MSAHEVTIWFESPSSIVEHFTIPPGLRVRLVWEITPEEADDWDWVAHCQVCGQRSLLISMTEVWTHEGMTSSLSHYQCDTMHLSEYRTVNEDAARMR